MGHGSGKAEAPGGEGPTAQKQFLLPSFPVQPVVEEGGESEGMSLVSLEDGGGEGGFSSLSVHCS